MSNQRPSSPVLPVHYRRNMLLLMIDFIFFIIGVNFVNTQSVLADFIGRLTGSETLVGLTTVLFPLGLIVPQLALAPAVARSSNKRLWVLVPGAPGRAMMFVIAAAILLLGTANPLPILAVVFIGYGTFGIADGISALGWLDLIGTALPNERRGRMFGIGRVIYSLAILFIVSDLVRTILDPATGPAYPHNYALLFFLCGVCLMISLAAFLFIREPKTAPPQATQLPPSWREYLAYLRRILRLDRRFRHYLLARATFEVAMLASPFYIRFATESLSLPRQDAVSNYILLSTLGGMVTGLLMGWLSERYGSRRVMLANCLFMLAQPVLALATHVGPVWLIYPAFAAAGMIGSTLEPGMLNWIVEYADDAHRAIYFSLTNTLNTFTVLSPVLGGVIAQQFSYEVVFGVALVLAALELVLVLRLIEPRVESPEARFQKAEFRVQGTEQR